jgi:hypothetical protein
MSKYLRRQTPRELLANALALHWQHLRLLFFIFALTGLVMDLAGTLVAFVAPAAASLFDVAWSTIVWMPLTVVISDACVGNKPSVAHAYSRGLDRVSTALKTAILLGIILLVGFICLVLPAILAMVWFMFSSSVVVLERCKATAALRRSKQLGQGYYFRNATLSIFAFIVTMVPAFVIAIIISTLAEQWWPGLPVFVDNLLFTSATTLMAACVGPFLGILTVLMYYDLRARKEGYDQAALLEDLRR